MTIVYRPIVSARILFIDAPYEQIDPLWPLQELKSTLQYFTYVPKPKFRFPGHQISWVCEWLSNWVIDWLSTRFFSTSYLSNGVLDRNESWHSGSQVGEDDARRSNIRITHAQRRESARYHARRRQQSPCVTSVVMLSLRTSVTTSHVADLLNSLCGVKNVQCSESLRLRAVSQHK